MNLTLGKKILFGFGLLTVGLLVVGGVGYRAIAGLGDALNEVGENRLPSIAALGDLRNTLATVQADERVMTMLRYEPALRRAAFQHMGEAFRQADAGRAIYDPLPQTTEEAALWRRFLPAWDKWKQDHTAVEDGARAVDAAVASGTALDAPELQVLRGRTYAAVLATATSNKAAKDLLDEVLALNLRVANESRVEAQALETRMTAMMVASILLGLIVAVGAALFLGRNISSILTALTKESEKLAAAVVDGRIGTRADVESINFEFRPIVQGMNDTMDAFTRPLDVAANYVDRISKGDIPPKITDPYNGDFNTLKNNLNTCVDAVNALVADAGMLAKAAADGKLQTRADAAKHGGDFRKIVSGVNDTID